MTHQEAIIESRGNHLVPDDKFDNHMSRARISDIDSRKAIFNQQTSDNVENRKARRSIEGSVY